MLDIRRHNVFNVTFVLIYKIVERSVGVTPRSRR
ncbi:MAG: hypothetical protein RIR11_1882, partial [Bacteroidota bacterium]